MPISRIFQAQTLHSGSLIELDDQASHHLARVLRAKVGDALVLFNGEGGEYQALITSIDKKSVTAKLGLLIEREAESPLKLCLAQAISRGEKMDYTIQKAVELGVHQIVPLFTERCSVKLDEEKRQKRLQHWQSIVVSACEQSGRNRLPTLLPPQNLNQWLKTAQADHCFVLAPQSGYQLKTGSVQKNSSVILLIGPEGGLSEAELAIVTARGFLSLNLGPRVLRTETAAVAALTALQCYFGDMTG